MVRSLKMINRYRNQQRELLTHWDMKILTLTLSFGAVQKRTKIVKELLFSTLLTSLLMTQSFFHLGASPLKRKLRTTMTSELKMIAKTPHRNNQSIQKKKARRPGRKQNCKWNPWKEAENGIITYWKKTWNLQVNSVSQAISWTSSTRLTIGKYVLELKQPLKSATKSTESSITKSWFKTVSVK